MDGIGDKREHDVLYTHGKSLEQCILEVAMQLHKEIKPLLLQRYVKKYVTVTLKEVMNAIIRSRDNSNDELSFKLNDTKVAVGRIGVSNKTIWDLLQANEKTSLVRVVFVGNTNKMSRVLLNPVYEEQIKKEILDMGYETKITQQETNVTIPVEAESLYDFIQATKLKLKTLPCRDTKEKAYYDKLEKSCMQAMQLVGKIEEVDGQQVIKEYWREEDTGRRYAIGSPNMQQANKYARHAALGDCYKYDFKACSFAIMVGLAKQIQPGIKVASIENFVRHRSEIRESIANQIGVDVEKIKKVFTSLGFGATPVNNYHNSIGKAMKENLPKEEGDEKFNALINNRTFSYIYEDLQKINTIICNHFQGEFEFLDKKYSLRDKEGKLRKDEQKLAWIYQRAESVILGLFTSVIKEECGMVPLMTVHDCAYYKQPVPNSIVQYAMDQIREVFPDVAIDREKIFTIKTAEKHANRFQEEENEEEAHRQRIKEQEALARQYMNRYSDNIRSHYEQESLIDKYSNMPDYEYELENFR